MFGGDNDWAAWIQKQSIDYCIHSFFRFFFFIFKDCFRDSLRKASSLHLASFEGPAPRVYIRRERDVALRQFAGVTPSHISSACASASVASFFLLRETWAASIMQHFER